MPIEIDPNDRKDKPTVQDPGPLPKKFDPAFLFVGAFVALIVVALIVAHFRK